MHLAIKDLLTEAGIEDAARETDLLFRHVCGASRLEREFLTEDECVRLKELSRRRAKREPLQYVLGGWAFLDLELALGPGVLIPRPETEEVCLAAADAIKGKIDPAILDLCAGSGALGLGLQSMLPAARVTCVELDDGAFPWLEQNVSAFRKGKGRRPEAVKADVLVWHEGLKDKSVDLIVANTPYVTAEEYEELAPELKFEPRQALVAEDDGLAFYKAIARDYRRVLKPGGYIVFEIGASQGPAVARILAEERYAGAGLRKDMGGHNRIALALRGI